MTCGLCAAIAVHGCPPQVRNRFNPACLHCGARHIQYIQRVLNLPKEAKSARCTEALKHWLKYGHNEQELRALAKKQEWAVQRQDKGKK